MAGTRRDAERALRGLVPERRDDGVTAEAVLRQWLADVETRGVSPATLVAYRAKVDGWLVPAFGSLHASVMTAAVIERQYAAWLREGRAPSTVRQCHTVLMAAWSLAERWGQVAPLTGVRAPSVPKEAGHEPPEPAQVAAWIGAAWSSDPTLAVAASVAVVTGMRRGEIVALRWSDVDLDGAKVVVSRSVGVVGAELVERTTKSGRTRVLALDARTVAMLRQMEPCGDRRVLGGSDEPVRPDDLSRRWNKLCGGACRFHDLRHFAGTQMGAAGVPVRAIMARLGHQQLSTVLRYTHAVDAADVAAADALGNVLAQCSTVRAEP